MKKEYDFSKGERGKFYHPNAVFNMPVYLDPDIAEFLSQIASQKKSDINIIVNDLLRKNIELIESVK